jgi:hypothetical protein
LAIALSASLRITASDYNFGIFKLCNIGYKTQNEDKQNKAKAKTKQKRNTEYEKQISNTNPLNNWL